MKYETIINDVITDPRTIQFQIDNADLYNEEYLSELFDKVNQISNIKLNLISENNSSSPTKETNCFSSFGELRATDKIKSNTESKSSTEEAGSAHLLVSCGV